MHSHPLRRVAGIPGVSTESIQISGQHTALNGRAGTQCTSIPPGVRQ
jgi:hypothetical protein